MLLKLLRFIFGYVKVEVFGFAPERFMNLIIKNEIVIWEVETTECGYIFYTGRQNLLRMKPYLQKTNMKHRLLNRYGLPYLMKRNRKRMFFVIGFGVFALAIYILSLFIWEVRIVGEDTLVAETLLEHIEEKYVPLGTLKSKLNCDKLEETLRKEYTDISWISCELKGTGLTVYLEEGMAPSNLEKKSLTGDIVAAKDAVITKMITREGTPVKKVTDTVKKGEILISGTIYIYDDNNEVMETSYIAADGDVYGTTTTMYEDYVDLKYYDKKYDGKKKRYITLFFLDYCFTPYLPNQPKTDYDTYTEIHKTKIFNNFYLPLGYKKTEWNTYSLERKTYDKSEATDLLKERLQKKIETLKEKGVEIVENNVTIEQDGERLIAKGSLVLKESIVEFKESQNALTDR